MHQQSGHLCGAALPGLVVLHGNILVIVVEKYSYDLPMSVFVSIVIIWYQPKQPSMKPACWTLESFGGCPKCLKISSCYRLMADLTSKIIRAKMTPPWSTYIHWNAPNLSFHIDIFRNQGHPVIFLSFASIGVAPACCPFRIRNVLLDPQEAALKFREAKKLPPVEGMSGHEDFPTSKMMRATLTPPWSTHIHWNAPHWNAPNGPNLSFHIDVLVLKNQVHPVIFLSFASIGVAPASCPFKNVLLDPQEAALKLREAKKLPPVEGIGGYEDFEKLADSYEARAKVYRQISDMLKDLSVGSEPSCVL